MCVCVCVCVCLLSQVIKVPQVANYFLLTEPILKFLILSALLQKTHLLRFIFYLFRYPLLFDTMSVVLRIC